MSQVPSGDPLGTARIDFTGNTAPIEAAAAKAVAVTEAAVVKAQAAVSGVRVNQTISSSYPVDAKMMESANRELAASADANTSSFGKMRGQLMGLAIPFAVAIGAANRLASAWDENDAEMEEFAKALGKDPIKALDDYSAKVEEVRSRTDSSFGSLKEAAKEWFNAVNPLDQYDLETQREKLEVLKALGVAITANADAERKRIADAKRAKKEQEESSLKDEVEAEILANKEGLEKIGMEQALWEKKRAERRKKLEDGGSDYEIYLLAKLDEAKKAGFDKRRAEYQKELSDKAAAEDAERTDKERKDNESADRVAKHAADALSRSLAQVQSAAASMFPVDKLSIQLTELGRIMERVASNTRNING